MKKKGLVAFLMSVMVMISGCQNSNDTNQYGWLVKEGAPTTEVTASEGQMYLDSSTYDLYQYTNGSWVLIGNIQGEDGKDGADGENGVNGQDGQKGEDGKTPVIEIINGYWYVDGVNTHVKAEGEGSSTTEPEKEKLTEEEFLSFPATFGSFPMPTSEWRARIEIGIKTQKGSKVSFIGDINKYRWAVVETYDLTNRTSGTYIDSDWNRNWSNTTASYTSTLDGGFLVLTIGIMDIKTGKETAFTQTDLDGLHSLFKVDAYKGEKGSDISNESSSSVNVSNEYIKSINHRGACFEAPENTLSAYRLSYKNGFKYVETDVSFTSDNIPVLLHDETIDRTSNGTGAISSMTYAEAAKYDYSYDSSNSELENKFINYRGEKLPKFEEFIILCKRLELHPYIEIKGGITFLQAKTLIEIVTKCSMLNNVSWISFNSNSLINILNNYKKARVGLVVSNFGDNTIDIVKTTLLTGQNEAFIDVWHTNATEKNVNLCIANSIPLEVWCCDTEEEILALNPYVSGVSSNCLIAENVFKENA